MTRGIIQLLIDAAPDSVRSVDNGSMKPLHILCGNDSMDETEAVEIFKLLIEKNPEAVRHVDNDGYLPIHFAAMVPPSYEFCQVLIEAYPGSERIANVNGRLPLHIACRCSPFATIKYLNDLYPDAINHATTNGIHPIHCAIRRARDRNKLTGAVEIVQYLLDCDPNVKFQMWNGISLLHFACLQTGHQEFNDSCIDTALEIIKTLYDAHPEAIDENIIVSNLQDYHEQVQRFISGEFVHARQAKDHRLMITPDDNGRLPLHTALQDNVRLGSIKLLVKGNPHAVLSPDISDAIPLHVACHHHESASVVRFLVGINTSTLDVADRGGNTALHYACRSARHEIIALLLDKFDAVSVSKLNVDGKLPIDLLWESNGDRESVAYTESVYRLMRAYPDMLMGIDVQVHCTSASCPSLTGKKRKLDH